MTSAQHEAALSGRLLIPSRQARSRAPVERDAAGRLIHIEQAVMVPRIGLVRPRNWTLVFSAPTASRCFIPRLSTQGSSWSDSSPMTGGTWMPSLITSPRSLDAQLRQEEILTGPSKLGVARAGEDTGGPPPGSQPHVQIREEAVLRLDPGGAEQLEQIPPRRNVARLAAERE